MELKQVKELISSMEKAGLTKLSIKEKNGFELVLEKSSKDVFCSTEAPVYLTPQSSNQVMQSAMAPKIEATVKEKEVEGVYVKSPMVGTFYSSPSPEHSPFIKVGDKVDENTVVCIVEAMKVLNEVKAGIAGTVAEILVKNGQAVEFGSKIVRIVQ
ncbi:MAG: acetyl-CoA carboxylase biotin carboxyl carrier protein [Rhabdochlamydiaceae bacterium]